MEVRAAKALATIRSSNEIDATSFSSSSAGGAKEVDAFVCRREELRGSVSVRGEASFCAEPSSS